MRQIALLNPNSIYFLTYQSVKSNKMITETGVCLNVLNGLKNGETSKDFF